MKHLGKRIETAKQILIILQEEPTRWTPIIMATIQNFTPWMVYSTLKWLEKRGYIVKPERGLYQITEKGKNLLNAITSF
ncbi:MAG: winged helix-turn-helix domain-containing protein [archaeon]